MTVAGLLRSWGTRELRALSIRQPHASLVALGEKHVETRSRLTKYRGPIAIASSASWKRVSKERACEDPAFRAAWRRHADVVDDVHDLPLGVIVAVGFVVDCVPSETIVAQKRRRLALASVRCGRSEIAFGDYSPRRFGWVLADIHRLEVPVPCKGALGIWHLPTPTRAQLIRSRIIFAD